MNIAEKFKFYFDWLKHEDNLAQSRASAMLVLQGLLFVGFLQIDRSDDQLDSIRNLIGYSGFGVSVLWTIIAFREQRFQSTIREKIKDVREYNDVDDNRNMFRRSFWLTNYVPAIGFAIGWIRVLCTA